MSDIDGDQDMRPGDRRPYGPYVALISLYTGLFGAFQLAYRRRENRLEQIGGLDLTMLGLATLRISKAISEDEITAVMRRPVVFRNDTGTYPRGSGLRWALGRLVLCPTCTGTWVAAFLAYALHLFPRQTRPLLAVMSASGIEQLSDALLSLVYTDRNVLRQQEERAP